MQTKSTLSTTEAATYLGISIDYLYKLMHRRKLRYYKPGGKLAYFTIDDLDLYKTSNPVEPISKDEASKKDAELEQKASTYITTNK